MPPNPPFTENKKISFNISVKGESGFICPGLYPIFSFGIGFVAVKKVAKIVTPPRSFPLSLS
jgi:hypothetical protein